MVLIGQIVAPVTLTYRLNERLNAIVSGVQASAKATAHGIPDEIVDFVSLIMEHRRHFLALRRH